MAYNKELKKWLDDPEFARYYGESGAKTSIALSIHEARIKAGLTQKELADKAGVKQEYIARLESGDANPTFGRIGNLLALMGFGLTTGLERLKPGEEHEQEPLKSYQVAVKDPLLVRDIEDTRIEHRTKKAKKSGRIK